MAPDLEMPAETQVIPREEVLRTHREQLTGSQEETVASRPLVPFLALGVAALLTVLLSVTVAFPIVRDQFPLFPSSGEDSGDRPIAGAETTGTDESTERAGTTGGSTARENTRADTTSERTTSRGETTEATRDEPTAREATDPPESASGPTGTATPSPEEPPESPPQEPEVGSEDALFAAVEDYYEAVERQDWTYTYENLDSQTRRQFSIGEWSSKNQWYEDNFPANIEFLDVEVLSFPSGGDTEARVSVRRTIDGADNIQVRDTVFVWEDGSWKHRFVGEELALFRPDLTFEEFVEFQEGDGGGSEEAEIVAVVEDYYEAVARQDWGYTYENLDAETTALFTRDEWYRKNQWYEDRSEPVDLTGVGVEISSISDDAPRLAEVTVTRTYDSGYVDVRDTVFVEEGEDWNHRFVGIELELFRPDLTFEEFVEEKE